MEKKRILQTSAAPAPVGPYSQAVEVAGFVFCSGQIAIDPAKNEVLTGDVKIQAKQVMENIKAVLHAADLNFEHVIKTTIFLTNIADFAAVNEIYATYFKANFPARSTVQVSGLPKGVNVEIEVTARRH